MFEYAGRRMHECDAAGFFYSKKARQMFRPPGLPFLQQ